MQHIVTTTIPVNAPAVRVITRLGFTHSATVDRWPQEHLQAGYEAAVGFTPNKEQPQQPVEFAPQQPHMLDHIPGDYPFQYGVFIFFFLAFFVCMFTFGRFGCLIAECAGRMLAGS